VGLFADIHSPFAQRFGSLVWPLAICLFLFVSYGRLYDAEKKIRRHIVVAIAISFIVILPSAWTIFRYLPTWSEILQSVY
jgi:hypothetical protein